MFRTVKLVSSLARCFSDTIPETLPQLKQATMMKNERFSFQLAYQGDGLSELCIDSPLEPWISVQRVCHVSCYKPVMIGHIHRNFCDKLTPGMYPIRLEPLTDKTVTADPEKLQTLWFDIKPDANIPTGSHTVRITLGDRTEELTLDVLDVALPEIDFMYTRWFHADCLATYYNCTPWSERHWQIIENFMKKAHEHGVNTILTPVFTLTLDTEKGYERPTTQLVRIIQKENGYDFLFDRLDRWIDLCLKVGFQNFEISHFYTPGLAAYPAKVAVERNGKEETLFSQNLPYDPEAYAAFLRAFLTAFLAHMKQRGLDKRCMFHIADEPNKDAVETYKKHKQNLADLLDGYVIMDALSDYDYYEQGLTSRPIPFIRKIEPFLEHRVPNLFTYYCGRANFAITWANSRGIARGLFKYDIAGLLNWGYNFYYSKGCVDLNIDPYRDNVAGIPFDWVPSGDPFIVYPAPDGTPYETIYLVIMTEMLQDLRAYHLCARLYGKQFVLDLMQETCGETVIGDSWVDPQDLLTLREKINIAILEKKDEIV